MIWHFFEVWLLLLVVFAVGCGFGAFLYGGLAFRPLAGVQVALADFVGDAVDEIKWRLGVGPHWRATARPTVQWPSSASAGNDFADDDPAGEMVSELPPLMEQSIPLDDELASEPDWEEDDAVVAEDPTDLDDLVPAEIDDPVRDDPVRTDTASKDDAMMRPAWLAEPRSSVPDNLQRIRGIGERNEELLHSLGIFHFGQIAAWTPAEMRWVAARLTFPESIEGYKWIEQAMMLASGGDPSKLTSTNRNEETDPSRDDV